MVLRNSCPPQRQPHKHDYRPTAVFFLCLFSCLSSLLPGRLLLFREAFASEAGRKYSENYITDWSWCRGLSRYFDWEKLLQKQRSCGILEIPLSNLLEDETKSQKESSSDPKASSDLFLCKKGGTEDDNQSTALEQDEAALEKAAIQGQLKLRKSDPLTEAEEYALESLDFALEWQWGRPVDLLCANGLVTAAMIILHRDVFWRRGAGVSSVSVADYVDGEGTQESDVVTVASSNDEKGNEASIKGPPTQAETFPLDAHRALSIEALLRRMADRVFLLDASLWGAKSFLVKEYFEKHSRVLDFPRNALPDSSEAAALLSESSSPKGPHQQGSVAHTMGNVFERTQNELKFYAAQHPEQTVTFIVPHLTEDTAKYLLDHFPQHLVLTFKAPENTSVDLSEEATEDKKSLDSSETTEDRKDVDIRSDVDHISEDLLDRTVISDEKPVVNMEARRVNKGEEGKTTIEEAVEDASQSYSWWLELQNSGLRNWYFFDRGDPATIDPPGVGVNGMAESVPTPLIFIVAKPDLLPTPAGLRELIRYQNKAEVTGGHVLLGHSPVEKKLLEAEFRIKAKDPADRSSKLQQLAPRSVTTTHLVHNDFCFVAAVKDWRLRFSSWYQESLFLPDESVTYESLLGTSIRGNWFGPDVALASVPEQDKDEDDQDAEDGASSAPDRKVERPEMNPPPSGGPLFPAKVCDTTSPSFLAKSEVIKRIPFDPEIRDPDLLALEYFLRLRQQQPRPVRVATPVSAEMTYLGGGGALSSSKVDRGNNKHAQHGMEKASSFGEDQLSHFLYGSAVFAKSSTQWSDDLSSRWRRRAGRFPTVTELREVELPFVSQGDVLHDGNVLVGLSSRQSASKGSSCTTCSRTTASSSSLEARPQGDTRLSPRQAEQARHRDDPRTAYLRHEHSAVISLGCDLSAQNCEIPAWVYRGWTAPPCCRRTLRTLLFYITDLFDAVGIRYLVTDGALLGALKYHQLIRWDADIDLQIHPDDFDAYLLRNEPINGSPEMATMAGRTDELQENLGTTSTSTTLSRKNQTVAGQITDDGFFLRKHETSLTQFLLQANVNNYLLIELNKRTYDAFDETPMLLPVEGRFLKASRSGLSLVQGWYGHGFLANRLRHVPEWEEEHNPLFCATPYHHNCAAGPTSKGTDVIKAAVPM
ncbi:unnamed protein product [Amoebophrya sp. A25]|nr:unnamed protein product [Amoebophrya sp. A25]|eukprot:GSA25T00009096001.1